MQVSSTSGSPRVKKRRDSKGSRTVPWQTTNPRNPPRVTRKFFILFSYLEALEIKILSKRESAICGFSDDELTLTLVVRNVSRSKLKEGITINK